MNPDIWINGRLVPWDEACIHPLCFSMQRGATLFESIDCQEAANSRAVVFRLRDHIFRFENSARIIGMTLPYGTDALCKAVTDTVAASGLKHVVIRPLAFWNEPLLGVHPETSPVTVLVGIGPGQPPRDRMTVTVASLRKIDAASMPVKAKVSANYIGPMMAKQEAVARGFDDAVVLDRDGFLAEGTTFNVFIVEGGRLVTAPDDAILPGITRDSIARIADHLGVPVVRERFAVDRLHRADEVILCSSGRGVTPIVRVDDTVIGTGGAGPVTARFRDLYRRIITGREPVFESWLTYV